MNSILFNRSLRVPSSASILSKPSPIIIYPVSLCIKIIQKMSQSRSITYNDWYQAREICSHHFGKHRACDTLKRCNSLPYSVNSASLLWWYPRNAGGLVQCNQSCRTGSNIVFSPTASSISVMISSVIFSITFKALTFSTICSGLDAPVMTEETFSFFKHHASANCDWVTPSFSAIGYFIRCGQLGVSVRAF
jgi:hypothetical protein